MCRKKIVSPNIIRNSIENVAMHGWDFFSNPVALFDREKSYKDDRKHLTKLQMNYYEFLRHAKTVGNEWLFSVST